MDDFVFRSWRWYRTEGMSEFDSIRYDLTLGVALDKTEATVRVHCWTNVEASLGAEVP